MLHVLALCGVGVERNGHEWKELAQSFVAFFPACLSIQGHHHMTRVVRNEYRLNGAYSFIRNLPSRLLLFLSSIHSVVAGSTVF